MAVEDFYPGWPIDAGTVAGSYSDDGEPKGALHTTEGKSYAGALSSFKRNNSWPHATITFERGRVDGHSHVPLSRPARSLRNQAGGVQTNRDRVAQLEIVGTCDTRRRGEPGWLYVEDFPTEYLDGIAGWMRWAEQELGIPAVCTVSFLSYPDSYGSNGVRLTGKAFDAYSGWLGHMHVPENDHGDPGLLAMAYLLGAPAPDPTPPPEDDVLTARYVKRPGALEVYLAGLAFCRPIKSFDDMDHQAREEGIRVLPWKTSPTPGYERVGDMHGTVRFVLAPDEPGCLQYGIPPIDA